MGTYTVQTISLTGLVTAQAAPPTNIFTTVAASDTFANDGHIFLMVKTVGTPTTVTVTSRTACNQGETHNVTVSVAANSEVFIGPFTPARFNDDSGNVTVGYNATTSVTAAAVKLVA